MVKEITDDTFNMISVDGDTSTNDSVMVLTNNQAGNQLIDDLDSDAYHQLKKHMYKVFEDLAIKIAKDGEGATKLLEVDLSGALSKEDAKILSKSVIQSSLVKSAFFGEDANWGRILCALGYSGAELDPMKVDLIFKNHMGSVQLLKNGENLAFDLEKAKTILSEDKIIIEININLGKFHAKAWGCDLSYDYVKINASYHT
jgi:glutamate N-acetyltransferase/amino-acid N-acetyltransferase